MKWLKINNYYVNLNNISEFSISDYGISFIIEGHLRFFDVESNPKRRDEKNLTPEEFIKVKRQLEDYIK